MINVENNPLEYFENFKLKNNAKRYQEDCNDFDLRELIKDDLLLKQREQCAYCEKKIKKENLTIEHVSPRDKEHKLECEYSNLVLSCQSNNSCDRYKGNRKWEDRYIHPVLNDPREYFEFSYNGEILSLANSAKDTIEFLNLNNDSLIRLRKHIILQLLNMQNIKNLAQYFNEHENLVEQFIKNI